MTLKQISMLDAWGKAGIGITLLAVLFHIMAIATSTYTISVSVVDFLLALIAGMILYHVIITNQTGKNIFLASLVNIPLHLGVEVCYMIFR